MQLVMQCINYNQELVAEISINQIFDLRIIPVCTVPKVPINIILFILLGRNNQYFGNKNKNNSRQRTKINCVTCNLLLKSVSLK
jgi:hypothetical protein